MLSNCLLMCSCLTVGFLDDLRIILSTKHGKASIGSLIHSSFDLLNMYSTGLIILYIVLCFSKVYHISALFFTRIYLFVNSLWFSL